MALALGSGYPVAFSLPGAAIFSIVAAALFGYLLEGDSAAYFHSGSPYQWLSAGVTNLRFVYWDVERSRGLGDVYKRQPLIPWLVISNTSKGEFIIDVFPLNPIATTTTIVATPKMYEPQAFT